MKETNPDGRLWIKLDGTDVKEALQHSVKNKWDGDVDLNDEKLETLRKEYERRLAHITSESDNITKETILSDINNDQCFLEKAMKMASADLKRKLAQKNASSETLKSLNWEVVECSTLLQQCINFIDKMKKTSNLSVLLKSLKCDFELYLKNLFKKKRTVATHILVIAVSDEQRRTKPYALPVQYVPYKSLKDQYVRDLITPLKEKLTDAGLQVVGEYLNQFNNIKSSSDI